MSSGYQQYGGNPYGQSEAGYGGSNPYGGTQEASNPYGGAPVDQQLNPPLPPLNQGDSTYSQASQYSQPAALPTHGSAPLSQQDFLARIDGAKGRITQLSSNIRDIASIHQRMLSSPDDRSTAQLEGIVSDTQIRNTQIKDEIKFLERDAAREPSNSLKRGQVENLKRSFKTQLEGFQKEESDYSKRYCEAIARQYRIVNPEATDMEVQEAANANWGDEGIFQQALKSNRSGQASSVLGAVRARHNDIQRIETTLGELALLFTQLNEAVVYQEEQVAVIDEGAERVKIDTEGGNAHLSKGIVSARRARKLKWWLLFVVVLILCIIGLALGLWFGVGGGKPKKDNAQ
ncbi:t-SNARE [Massariosphaeria phaeospora]|uniref:t-SNARE n=1 Tax=Massariosphaeria phaeospora TaxID=100035 RepID=A0A7C8HYV8_9PLEO|nr:t-SNARE [Massariosphaeria phaeospora]